MWEGLNERDLVRRRGSEGRVGGKEGDGGGSGLERLLYRCLTSTVNVYGHGGAASLPYLIFSLAGLDLGAVNQY